MWLFSYKIENCGHEMIYTGVGRMRIELIVLTISDEWEETNDNKADSKLVDSGSSAYARNWSQGKTKYHGNIGYHIAIFI